MCGEFSSASDNGKDLVEENPEVQGELDFVLGSKGEEKGNSLVFHASIARGHGFDFWSGN